MQFIYNWLTLPLLELETVVEILTLQSANNLCVSLVLHKIVQVAVEGSKEAEWFSWSFKSGLQDAQASPWLFLENHGFRLCETR